MERILQQTFLVGKQRFREERLQRELEWDYDSLNEFNIHSTPCGGALAVVKDPSRIIMLGQDRTFLHVYTAYGQFLAKKETRTWTNLIHMGWTMDEELVVIFGDGRIELYDVLLNILKTFDLRQPIVAATVFNRSAYVISDTYEMYELSNVRESRALDFRAKTGLSSPPTHIQASKVRHSDSGTDIWLVTDIGEIIQVGQEDAFRTDIQSMGPVVQMSLSANAKWMALCYEKGKLRFINLDNHNEQSLVETQQNHLLVQMKWCGNEGVLLTFREIVAETMEEEDTIIFITLDKHRKEFHYDCPVQLASENDGCRIYTSSFSVFLSPLPQCVNDVFGIGSSHPAAMLKQAYYQYLQHVPSVYQLIQLCRPHMDQAVGTLLNTAQYMFDAKDQITLLKAASFGLSFLNEDDSNRQHSHAKNRSDAIIQHSMRFRVVNALRDKSVGIPATLSQLTVLTTPTLIHRLCGRHLYLLASRISSFLHLPNDTVLLHWAKTLVSQEHKPDSQVLVEQIVSKFSQCEGISYARIAKEVAERGEVELASMLLDYETDPTRQIKTLLSIHEERKAIKKAADHKDLLLMYRCIYKVRPPLHTLKNWNPDDDRIINFVNLILVDQRAVQLFLSLTRRMGLNELELYKMVQHRFNENESYRHMALCAYEEQSLESRMEVFQSCQKLFNQKVPSAQFTAAQLKQHTKLLTEQERATVELGILNPADGRQPKKLPFHPTGITVAHETGVVGPNGYIDMSLRDFLFELFCRGEDANAEKLIKDFGVSPRRATWIKLDAFVKTNHFKGIEKIAGDGRKCPVSMEAFVERLMKHGQPREAIKYARLVQNKIARCELLYNVTSALELPRFQEADEVAKQITSIDELKALLGRLSDPHDQYCLLTMLDPGRFAYNESINGVRMPWSTIPADQMEAAQLGVPNAILFTPTKHLAREQMILSEPVMCERCKSIINYTCPIMTQQQAWFCSVCRTQNRLPERYAGVTRDNRPPELAYQTVEYVLPAQTPRWPTFFLVLDTVVLEHEFASLKEVITQTIQLLPSEFNIALITIGKAVRIYDLGSSDSVRSFAFSGTKEYTTAQYAALLGLTNQPPPSATGFYRPRFVCPVSEASLNLTTILNKLKVDPNPPEVNFRGQRATGGAIHLAVCLAEALCKDSPCRILTFLSGPCTVGLGQVNGIKEEEKMRQHRNIQDGTNLKYCKDATNFYNSVAKRASINGHSVDLFMGCIDQVGFFEMRDLTELTGGLACLCDSFGSTQFRLTVQQIFDRGDCQPQDLDMAFTCIVRANGSKELKNLRCLGQVLPIQGDQNRKIDENYLGPSELWHTGAFDSTSTLCFLFESALSSKGKGNQPFDSSQVEAPAVVQIVTRYSLPTRQILQRVTTCQFRWVLPGPSTTKLYAESFDAEAAAVVVARIAITKAETESTFDVLRWIDRLLIKLAARLSKIAPNPNPAQSSLSSVQVSFFPEFVMFPQFMFYLRRSRFLRLFNATPDETAFFRTVLRRETVDNSLIMIQPSLTSYKIEEEPQPVRLDTSSISKDRILLLDTFFRIIIHHGEQICEWRELGYHHQPQYQSFKTLLQQPTADAEAILSERGLTPHVIVCDQNSSQARFLVSNLNPSISSSAQEKIAPFSNLGQPQPNPSPSPSPSPLKSLFSFGQKSQNTPQGDTPKASHQVVDAEASSLPVFSDDVNLAKFVENLQSMIIPIAAKMGEQ
ncbi:putative Protein transport protein sec23 [Blattamonas nauphoetae]|uniref:Protein transport protein SEC23 n=1 Tax=Blattamonas nauphoetae TaxID=2049346 RepID=A0ABQ9YM09_9EUKA|nr:putative Protein transport protein sec23 [Blattamonas nauphoetae]